jgi:hypothetical protein
VIPRLLALLSGRGSASNRREGGRSTIKRMGRKTNKA